MKDTLRRIFRWTHLWLGLVTGVFICLMGFTGGLVALRPQIATLLSAPKSAGPCDPAPDWNRAANDIEAFAQAPINRVYGPYGSDTRYHFRIATDDPIIYRHVIYDACDGRVLGFINMAWMDWTVDLHHNLLNGRVGRQWAGVMGIAMLLSALSGLLVWLLVKPDPGTAFQVRFSLSKRTPRELHRAFGLVAMIFIMLEAVTGIGLAFPQTLRGMVATVAPMGQEVRPGRVRKVPHPPKEPALVP